MPAKKTVAAAAAPVALQDVDVKIEEELTVKMSRDGLIETADVKGTLAVRVNSADASHVLIKLNDFAADGFQLQMHPTIARSFLSDHVIMLKQADRGFPVDSSVSALAPAVGRRRAGAADGDVLARGAGGRVQRERGVHAEPGRAAGAVERAHLHPAAERRVARDRVDRRQLPLRGGDARA